jgi:hypothetical protein
MDLKGKVEIVNGEEKGIGMDNVRKLLKKGIKGV